MKKTSFCLLLGCAALLAGCALSRQPAGHALQPKVPYGIDLPVALATTAYDPRFEQGVVGMKADEVLRALGRPSERVTPELWVYWEYVSPDAAENPDGNDTLVVAFTQGKVSGMKLIRGDVLRARLERRHAPAAL